MRLSIVADSHLNKATYSHIKDKIHSHLPFRTVDFMKAFTFTVDKTIEKNADLFVLAGDSFDTFYPGNDVSGFFNAQLKRLKNNNVDSIIMVGNHDVSKKSHALKPLKELDLDFAKIIDEPNMMVYKNNILMLFPYSLEVEQDKISVKEQFNKFIADCKKKIQEDPSLANMQILFFGHFGVMGASMNQYADKPHGLITDKIMKRMSKRSFRNYNESSITVKDLDEIGAHYVWLGDYHNHQVLKTEHCISMYVGSIERGDINEMGQKKGFVFYDSDAEVKGTIGRCRYVEYDSCRSFVELRGNWSEIKDAAKMLDDSNKGAIVKISFSGSRAQLVDCASGLPKLKDELRTKIDPIHIVYEQNIIDDNDTINAKEIEQEIIDRGYIEKTDIIDVASDMIDEVEKDESEKNELVKLAHAIYDEVTGEN